MCHFGVTEGVFEMSITAGVYYYFLVATEGKTCYYGNAQLLFI